MENNTNKTALELAIENNKIAMKEKIAEIKLNTELKRLSSASYMNRQIAKEDALIISALIETFAEPEFVEDCKPGTEFKLRKVFGYGVQVDSLLTLARTIQFSQQDIKVKLLETTNLTEDLLEDISEALGASPYFSEKTMDIVESIDPDLDELKELLTFMGQELGLALPVKMNKLNDKHIQDMYKYQLAKANLDMENTINYLELSNKGADNDNTRFDI